MVDIRNERNGLSEMDMHTLGSGQSLIVFVRDFDRARFGTSSTPGTQIFFDVSRSLEERYFEVSCFPLYAEDFGVSKYLDISLPVDLDQFR